MKKAKNNVESLYGDAVVTREAQPEVVALLKALLEAAESGEIVGINAVVLYSDEATGTRCAGMATQATLGAIVRLQHRLVRELENNGV